jgi:hypothetical protein
MHLISIDDLDRDIETLFELVTAFSGGVGR